MENLRVMSFSSTGESALLMSDIKKMYVKTRVQKLRTLAVMKITSCVKPEIFVL